MLATTTAPLPFPFFSALFGACQGRVRVCVFFLVAKNAIVTQQLNLISSSDVFVFCLRDVPKQLEAGGLGV